LHDGRVEMPKSDLPRGTVTFLFTDIEGSTALARRLGNRFGAARSEHRRLLRESFERYGGYEIDTAGDGFFVVFQRAGDAIGAVAAAQRALGAWATEAEAPVRVRMGLHTAEPFLDGEGYVGVGVHRAARICAVGHGGQILLSNATAGVVEDLGLEGVELQDLGEHRLKDLDRPQRLFQLNVDGLSTDFPPPASLDLAGTGPAIVTLLACDLAGWRTYMRAVGDDQAVATATTYHDIARREADSHGGRLVEAIADNVVLVFERPRDAIVAAIAIRDALRVEPWIADKHRCPVRSAVHSGRVVGSQGGLLGSTAMRTLALCEAAEPDQVVVSHSSEALLEGDVTDFRLRDLGERTVDWLDRPARLFAVAD
jgi:class 3 adenylate cyclase